MDLNHNNKEKELNHSKIHIETKDTLSNNNIKGIKFQLLGTVLTNKMM